MKKYIKPEIRIVLFETTDVIAASSAGEEQTGRFLTKIVNEKVGDDYGAEGVSIFDN